MTVHLYDVRTEDKAYEKILESKYGVRMSKEEEDFYNDNCHGERKRASGSVCRSWLKGKTRKDQEETRLAKRIEELDETKRREEDSEPLR